MNDKSEYWIEIDEKGRVVLPPEVMERYGLQPGTQIRLKESPKSLQLQRPITQLVKVYVEVTSRCNLNCRTCVRNNWDETQGDMDEHTFDRLVDDLGKLPYRPDVIFGGFGEPLLISNIGRRVERMKEVAGKVELITNSILLTREKALELINAGLDVLWVSVDGVTSLSFDNIRVGASLSNVLENIIQFSNLRNPANLKPEIGISFVAMKKNIADLPGLIRLSSRLGASRYMITNVLPHTEEMCREILYHRAVDGIDSAPSHYAPRIDMPRIDMSESTQAAVVQTMRYRNNVHWNGVTLGQERGHCPFIESGSVSISWDGKVSPCLALMHNYTTYLNDQRRTVKKYTIGDINKNTLQEIWEQPEHMAFRKRVEEFDFSPCTWCGGCEMSESNEEDCFGNVFPTCGGCLWAQGVIQCP